MDITPFELVYGRDAILPIDLQLESWSVVDWECDDSESLLLARMKQLDERNLKVSQATWNLENSRKAIYIFQRDCLVRSKHITIHVPTRLHDL